MGRGGGEEWTGGGGCELGTHRCHDPHGSVRRILKRDLRKIYGWGAALSVPGGDRKEGNGETCASSVRSLTAAEGWGAPCDSAPAAPDPRQLYLSLPPQDFLQGDCTKAKQKLSWKPRVAFDVSAFLYGWWTPLARSLPGWAEAGPAGGAAGPARQRGARSSSAPGPLGARGAPGLEG